MSAAEVLDGHQWRGDFLGCGCGWNWPARTHFCGEAERIAKAHVRHQLDALKAAGYAVVRTASGDHDPFDILCAVNRGEATKSDAICPRCRPAADAAEAR